MTAKTEGVIEGVTQVVTEDESDDEPQTAAAPTPRRRASRRPRTDTDDWFSDLAPDSYVLVSRLSDATKTWVHLGRLAPHEVGVEELSERGGGGRYKLNEKIRNENGRMVYGRQTQIVVGGEVIPDTLTKFSQASGKEKPEAPAALGSAPGAQRTTMDDVMTAGVINMMQTQQKSMDAQTQSFQAVIAMSANRPTVDWGAVLTASVPIVTALLTKKAPDPIEIIAKLGEVMKNNIVPPSPLTEQLGIVDQLMDLKAKMEPEPKDPLMVLATEQLPKLIDMIQDEQKRKGSAPVTPEDLRKRVSSGEQPAQPAGDDAFGKFMAVFGPRVVNLAQSGVGSESAADVIIHTIPPATLHGPFKTFMGKPDAGVLLMKAVPELQNFEEWTEQTFNVVYEFLYPEEFTDDAEGAEGEDVDDGGAEGPSE